MDDNLDQCRDCSDIGESIHLGFHHLGNHLNALQQKIASLHGDTVLSEGHRQYISNLMDQLASEFSAAPTAIVENTNVTLPEVKNEVERRDDDEKPEVKDE